MPGALRFFLAFVVAASHLLGTDYAEYLGFYAVRGFFVLSAFAVTHALHETYAFDLKRFGVNRLLRLMPLYIAACGLTALIIALNPLDAARFMPRWGAHAGPTEILENLAILPQAFAGLQFRYIEPAWSTAVELFMYMALWIGMGRSAKGAAAGFVVGLIYHVAHLAAGDAFAQRYFTIESALLSFGFGALLFFAPARGLIARDRRFALLALGLWAANFFAAGLIVPQIFAEGLGYYLNIALAGAVIISQPAFAPGPWLRRIDRILGELSYPVFLVQWIGGFAAYRMIGETELRGWEVALAAAPLILIMAIALALLNRRFVEPLRARVRASEPGRAELAVAPSAKAA